MSAMTRTLHVAFLLLFTAGSAAADPQTWACEWPRTDFDQTSIDYSEILSGGPPRDGIPSIDAPVFGSVAEISNIGPMEPVITLSVGDETRAYPLRVLIWHEIVNDTIGGVPVAVTYCPLCNASIVFDRRIDGEAVEFGTTGKLRNSDLVMYDRKTESWWQQFLGAAIVGELNGTRLKMLPARVEPYGAFASDHPHGRVLVPGDPRRRNYGANPYMGYDSSGYPFLYRDDMPEGIGPLEYVVVAGDQAWTLNAVRRAGKVADGDLAINWSAGQNSALDAREIAAGRDIGSVRVTRAGVDIPHHVTFAFVFHAFTDKGRIVTSNAPIIWSRTE